MGVREPAYRANIVHLLRVFEEMKERSERQVASIYVVNNHNGLITRTLENVMRWYNNTIQVHFVDSVESAVQHQAASCA